VNWPDLLKNAVDSPRETETWHFVSIRENDQWRRIARFDDSGPATMVAALLTAAGYQARSVAGGPKR